MKHTDVEPTLAKKYTKQDVRGWLASEKLDGVRAIWDGEQLISKDGKVFDAPKSFTDELPPTALDGELFIARREAKLLASVVDRKEPEDEEERKEWEEGWRWVVYHVFDLYGDPRPYPERHTALVALIQTPSWTLVPQLLCTRSESVWALCDHYRQMGGGGVMLRNPKGGYEYGRTSNLLSVTRPEKVRAKAEKKKKGTT